MDREDSLSAPSSNGLLKIEKYVINLWTKKNHKADVLLTSLPAKRGVVLHFRILELRHQSIRLCNMYILLCLFIFFFHKSSS